MVILLANGINSQTVLLNSFMKTYLFMAGLGFHFCSWASSSCCHWGVILRSGSQTSQWLLLLQRTGARHLGFDSRGLWALEPRAQ